MTADRMTPEYAAGFFDGEGNLNVTTSAGAAAKVVQVDVRPLALLQAEFGGSLSEVRTRGRQSRTFAWQVSGENLDRFLETIAPHAIVKAEEIAALRDYRRTFNGERRHITPENRARREACLARFRAWRRTEFVLEEFA